jgi:hypothetical protein
MGERPSVEEAKGWIGSRLDEIEGVTVGRVQGVYVDEQSGEPEWLLARMGRLGRHSLVPAPNAVGGAGHVWVPYPRQMLRRGPRFEPGQTLDLNREAQLSAHYEVGRAMRLAGRSPTTITARPAG